MSPARAPRSTCQTSTDATASTANVARSASATRATKRLWRSPHVDNRRSSWASTIQYSDAGVFFPHESRSAADTRIVDAAQIPAPQLGRILVAAGLLNEEQLALALEEQTRTGGRLGEIIVRRGFISGPALANALAEQHGGVLKTEYGFATGLGGDAARRAASEGGKSFSPLRPPAPPPMPTLRAAEPQ